MLVWSLLAVMNIVLSTNQSLVFDCQPIRMKYLPVLAVLHVHDGLAVVTDHWLGLLLSLEVPLDQVTIIVTSEEEIIETTPQHGGDLGTIGTGNGDLEDGFISEVPGVNHLDLTRIPHLLVSGEGDHVATEAEVGGPHGRLGVDLVDFLTSLNVPESDRVVRSSGDQVRGVPLWIQTPDSTTVT